MFAFFTRVWQCWPMFSLWSILNPMSVSTGLLASCCFYVQWTVPLKVQILTVIYFLIILGRFSNLPALLWIMFEVLSPFQVCNLKNTFVCIYNCMFVWWNNVCVHRNWFDTAFQSAIGNYFAHMSCSDGLLHVQFVQYLLSLLMQVVCKECQVFP